LTFGHKSGFWQNFTMTYLETLYMKNAVNELSFTPVTHTTYSDTRFCRYSFLKSGYTAELFWTAWTLEQKPALGSSKRVVLDEA
jgi:hypothetical protein